MPSPHGFRGVDLNPLPKGGHMTQAWPRSYSGGFGEHVAMARPVAVPCGILLGPLWLHSW